MNQIDSRLLRYFVAVAQELNFTRAAEHLGIAPPALSRAVAQLEALLEVKLLERSTRQVRLTPAGATLLDEGLPALDVLDAATRRARRVADPEQKLVLAFKADLDGGLLDPILAAYRRENSEIPIEIMLCGWGEQARLLRQGRADVALVYAPIDERALDSEVLLEERRVVAMARDEPLASHTAVRSSDLAARYKQTHAPSIWIRRDEASGRTPDVADLTQMLRLVELSQLVILLPQSVADRYPRAQIAYRPLMDEPPASLLVAWSQSSHSLATAAFVRAAIEVAATHRDQSQGRKSRSV
ncbi:MAG TPA: LysR family transcriptional regulator [Baekduia sp.]|nr:LysR family transcriptional regulator [Baekduia sp.]